ncbi:MAG: hypothetical protein AAB358_00495 [Patescibacteria group bacterium]
MKKIIIVSGIVVAVAVIAAITITATNPKSSDGIGAQNSNQNLPAKRSGICSYRIEEIFVDAACNQLAIHVENGYLRTPNKFQDEILNLISDYKGRIISRNDGSSNLLAEFPDDKRIYEIKDKLINIEHVKSVNFNMVAELE